MMIDNMKLKIYVAAPEDVQLERDYLEALVKELSLPDKEANQLGFELRTLNWSAFLDYYLIEQKKTNIDLWPLKPWDIFIGILRFSFDKLDKETPMEESSTLPKGAEKVFKFAFQAWKETGKPRLLLYRSHSSFSPSRIDPLQHKKIQAFFEEFNVESQKSKSYRIFKNIQKFKDFVKEDLINILEEFRLYRLLSKEIKPIEIEIPAVKSEIIEKKYETEKAKEITFLRVSSLFHNYQLKDQPVEKLTLLLKNYYNFVDKLISQYNGTLISRYIDGSVWAFQGENKCDRTVGAGIVIMSRHNDFKSDKTVNPCNVELSPRISAILGSLDATSQIKPSYIRSRNYATHLEKHNTPPGAFVITDLLYQKISDFYKNEFKYEKDYEYHTLYSYTVPQKKVPFSSIELENIKTKIEDFVEVLSEILNITTYRKNSEPKYEEMRECVEKMYRTYEKCYFRASANFSSWSEVYLIKLIDFFNFIQKQEDRLIQKFENLPVELKKIDLEKPSLISILYFIGSLRIHPISNIDLLLRKLKKHSAGENIDSILDEYIKEKIVNFIKSDNFNEETAFAQLFLTEELTKKLGKFISTQYRDYLYEKLISRFWKLADFIRIEDQYSGNRQKDQKIFPLLIIEHDKNEVVRYKRYFRVIQSLLIKDNIPTKQVIIGRFNSFQIEPENTDIDIVWKCLLIDHPNYIIRKYVIEHIEFKELWNIIAYSKTPLSVLKEISEHLLYQSSKDDEKEKATDRMKIFFLLTLIGIINDLFTPLTANSLRQIELIIEIFYQFSFFSESRYFQRLNDLYMRFKKVAREDEIEIIEIARKRLEQDLKGSKGVLEKPPKCLNELPPAVQKKLARGGEYLIYFCTSTNNEVADEVFRYINYNNIVSFITITAMNVRLFKKILRTKEFFQNSSAIKAALCHPHCTKDFASLHASRLSQSELNKIVNNRNLNSEVRTIINNKLIIKKNKI